MRNLTPFLLRKQASKNENELIHLCLAVSAAILALAVLSFIFPPLFEQQRHIAGSGTRYKTVTRGTNKLLQWLQLSYTLTDLTRELGLQSHIIYVCYAVPDGMLSHKLQKGTDYLSPHQCTCSTSHCVWLYQMLNKYVLSDGTTLQQFTLCSSSSNSHRSALEWDDFWRLPTLTLRMKLTQTPVTHLPTVAFLVIDVKVTECYFLMNLLHFSFLALLVVYAAYSAVAASAGRQ